MKKLILALCLGGVLFSGYLSAVKLVTQTCAFNEPCPYVWGLPACWYGFVMYVAMAAAAIVAIKKPFIEKRAVKTILLISFIGILFAGRLTVPELQPLISGTTYELILPTCAYGFIFYIIIFILSLWFLAKKKG